MARTVQSKNSQKHYRTCNLCEALCGISIEYQDKQIISIKGDSDDPFSKGYICPKATALQDIHQDPDRLRKPVRKTGDGWEEISWQQAFDSVANKVKALQQNHGRDSVATYVGNPTAHNHGNLIMLKGFLDAIGSRNRYSATSVDQLPVMLAAKNLFGSTALFPVPDVDRMQYLIIIGANPIASGGSFMSGPNIKKRLAAIQQRGGQVITIDPRFTETAAIASQHHYINPGKDAYLLLAMIHEIFARGLERCGHLALENIPILRSAVKPFSPQRVAQMVDIKADVISQLARQLALQPHAAVYGRLGTCIQQQGALCSWLIYVLNIITANMDVEGGMMFTRPAIDLAGWGAVSRQVNGFDQQRSRVRNLPSFAAEFPAATLADEILTPGHGQIKALITLAGNPVLSLPNGRKLEKALAGLDFMLSFDMYINETSRHADIIIPPTSPLEHGYYALAIQLVAYRHTAKYSPALFEKPEGSYHEWQSMLEIMTRIYSRDFITTAWGKFLYGINNWLGDEGILNLLLKMGPYGGIPRPIYWLHRRLGRINILNLGSYYKNALAFISTQLKRSTLANSILQASPFGDYSYPVLGGLTLNKLLENPHGVDIGALKSVMPDRLRTKNKKINLEPGMYNDLIQGLAESLERNSVEGEQAYNLSLIGRRHLRSNNSWLHNSYRLVKGKNRCTLLMHPNDAGAQNFSNGDAVRVISKVGEIEIELQITDQIKPGVVSIPHGWGHHRQGTCLSVAHKYAGVSINDITDDSVVEGLTGQAICNGIPVKVLALSNETRAENAE